MGTEKYTVIFLVEHDPPDKILLLKRAPSKSFAPNYYTGIGGKVGDAPEYADESVLDGAYRELEEETLGNLTKDNIQLRAFARCVFESGIELHYFWGILEGSTTPVFSQSDGTLTWVSTETLFQRKIIPTTQVICKEWAQRGFSLHKLFTVTVREVGVEDTVRLVGVTKVENGPF
jgi:ADP-ribose pyrophosphatase YjhB (NUDIX family)